MECIPETGLVLCGFHQPAFYLGIRFAAFNDFHDCRSFDKKVFMAQQRYQLIRLHLWNVIRQTAAFHASFS